MFAALPFILAIISRWHGSEIGQNKVVKNLAWGLTFGGATWFLLYGSLGAGWLLAILSVTAGLLCLAGKATGHGRGLGLHEPIKGSPEVLEILTAWAIPYIPSYWYKVGVLSLSGFAASCGPVLALLCMPQFAEIEQLNSNYTLALIIATGGIMKGPGYMVGQWLEDRKALLRFYKMFKVHIYSNQIGEFLAGFFAGLGLLLANILI